VTENPVEESLVHNALQLDAALLIIIDDITNIRRAVGDFWCDPTHVQPYPVSALSKLLRRTGLEIVTDRKPSVGCSIAYAIRNALLGRYWVGDDLYAIARRKA